MFSKPRYGNGEVSSGKPGFYPGSNLFVQPKLSINDPNDRYEKEADDTADKVMRMETPFIQAKPVAISAIQRKCEHCEEEEEEKKMQRKEMNGEQATTGSTLENYVNSLSYSGQALPTEVRNFYEPRFGYDFSNVKVHTDTVAAKSAQSINALAYTSGNNIVFNQGQFSPQTDSGKKLLGHELTHVVQQQGNTAARKIMRQRASNDVTEFTEDGNRYRITRVRVPVITTGRRPFPPRASVGMDSTNIFLDVSWCRGSVSGNIRFGANVPQQVQNLFTTIIQQIQQGATPSAIQQTIINTDITPFITTQIIQSGGWQISGDIHVTVDRTGVTSGGVGVTGRSGPFDVNLGVEADNRGGVIVGGNVRVTPGRQDPTFTCPTQERIRLELRNQYTCEQWRRRQEDRTRTVPVTDSDSRFIYYNYAVDVIDERRSAPELAQIEQRLREGFQVQAIHGFTSPEGPRPRGRRFRGNDQLSTDRANAALQRLQQIIQRLNLDGTVANVSPDVIPLGESELYTQTEVGPRGREREVEGAPLVQNAEEEFRTQPAEERHRAPAEEQLEHARTPQQRADIIYPLLRRAVVVFARQRQEQQHYQETVEGFVPVDCATVPNFDTHTAGFRMF